MNTTPQREFWNGQPVQLETVWTLTKRGHVAQCALFSHQFGWELRLEVGELFRTQVCRSIGRSRTCRRPGEQPWSRRGGTSEHGTGSSNA